MSSVDSVWWLIWHLCNIKDNHAINQLYPKISLFGIDGNTTCHSRMKFENKSLSCNAAQNNSPSKMIDSPSFSNLLLWQTFDSRTLPHSKHYRFLQISYKFQKDMTVKLSLFDNTCQRQHNIKTLLFLKDTTPDWQHSSKELQCTLSTNSYAMISLFCCINW